MTRKELRETRLQRSLGLLKFSLLSVAVGIVAGFGTVIFRALIIALFHNLFFLGELSTEYDANVHPPDDHITKVLVKYEELFSGETSFELFQNVEFGTCN